ncbi:hypothetical protein ABQE44_13425 [Mycolicibacterium sp. XJ2546]
MPVNELPQPENWRDRNVLITLGILLGAASAVAAVVLTFDKLQHAEYLTAAITLGAAVLCSCFTVLGLRAQFMTLPLRATFDPSGTVLLSDLVGVWLVTIAFVAAVVSGTLFVIFVPQGAVDLPLTSADRIFDPVLIGTMVIIAAAGLIGIAHRRGAGHLRLGPKGVENVDIVFIRQSSWDDIIDITDESANKQDRHPIVFVIKNDKPIVVKNASGYAPSGAALYWMVRHYWKHPERRDELTDGRALERLRNEQFDVS